LVRHGLGFERFLFFSDAVFAIAITLLVVDLKPGPGPFSIRPALPHIIGFCITFYVIGQYWLAHHELMETVQGYDRRLLAANLFFLAGVAFLPYSTSIVATGDDRPPGVIFYALSLALVGFLLLVLVLVVRREGLLKPDQTRGDTARRVIVGAASPLVFCFTAAAAAFLQHGALWLLALLFPVRRALSIVGDRVARRVDGALTAT
jgi:uncharacterized membrane protein